MGTCSGPNSLEGLALRGAGSHIHRVRIFQDMGTFPYLEAYTAGSEATLSSLEIVNADAFVFQTAGAAPGAPREARRARVGRGPRTYAELRDGSPGNLGGPVLSMREKSLRESPATAKAPARRRSTAQRRERGSEHGNAGRHGTGWRNNKPKGSKAGSRSVLIVPALCAAAHVRRRRGTASGGTRWREAGHLMCRAMGGKRWRKH